MQKSNAKATNPTKAKQDAEHAWLAAQTQGRKYNQKRDSKTEFSQAQRRKSTPLPDAQKAKPHRRKPTNPQTVFDKIEKRFGKKTPTEFRFSRKRLRKKCQTVFHKTEKRFSKKIFWN